MYLIIKVFLTASASSATFALWRQFTHGYFFTQALAFSLMVWGLWLLYSFIKINWWKKRITSESHLIISLGLCISLLFLAVVPTTVDRSISVFMLATLDSRTEMSKSELLDVLQNEYMTVAEVERRWDEQIHVGDAIAVGETLRISDRGRSTAMLNRVISKLFNLTSKYVDGA
jgi:hypothetical protein